MDSRRYLWCSVVAVARCRALQQKLHDNDNRNMTYLVRNIVRGINVVDATVTE